MSMRARIDMWRYKRRARRLAYYINVCGVEVAAAWAIRKGWVRRDLWESERRLQLLPLRGEG